MNNKQCLFRQPAGLGDIFFLQKAASNFIDNGYDIIWPIADHYGWIIDYIDRDGITFYCEHEDFPYKQYYDRQLPIITEDFVFMPFESADRILNMPAMKAKYPLVYMSPDGWQNHFTFERDEEREELLKKELKLKDNDDFIFVNDMLGSPPNIFTRPIDIQTDHRIIKNSIELFHKFNPMDYCWILENAKEIHTVETCFCYLVEKLETTDNLFLYSRMVDGRQQNENFSYIDFVYDKNWDMIRTTSNLVKEY